MLAMSKKSVLLTSIVLLFAAVSITHAAAVNWSNGDGNQHWGDPNNWVGGAIPYCDPINNNTHSDDAQIVLAGSNAVIYDATDNNGGQPRYVYFIVVGFGTGVNGEMWMNGGSLYSPWELTFNKSGNASSNSKLHITGGLLNLGSWPGYIGVVRGYFALGRAGTADCNMTGGTVQCQALQIPEFGYTNIGTLELNGGVITASNATAPFTMGSTGALKITKGKLILAGDLRTTVNGYIGSGWIVAYPSDTGRKVLNVDYGNINPGNTTVTASLTTLTQAWNPQPVDTHSKVNSAAILAWNPGVGAVSHNVYLGSSWSDVNDGVVTPVTVDVNNYNPNGLNFGQTYYWRVDEFDGSSTYKGVVWSFTVQSDPFATNPNPADGATGVSTSVGLTWVPGVGSVSNNVYFGISYNDVNDANNPNVLPGKGTQTANSYSPGTLALGQTYYWRIDEFDGSFVHKGSVWSFTTTAPPAAQAPPPPYLGDIITVSGDDDDAVTWEDMWLIASNWLTNNCNTSADLTGDCHVDMKDYADVAKDWLKSTPKCNGNTYYVATTGSDSNPGTVSLPWATIQNAASVMAAGDTTIVEPGTYNGQVTVGNSGSSQGCGFSESPITFLAAQSGDVIVNANDSANNNGFYVIGKAYIVIDGFKITGGRDGIFFDGGGEVYDAYPYDAYNVIRNCQIYSNGRDGIRIYQADKVKVEKCMLYGNTEAGLKTISGVSDLQVSKCGMYGNGTGLSLVGDGTITDSIVTNNTTAGIKADVNSIVTYCDVWNNTPNYSGGASAGTGCISADPTFVNPGTDFHLLAGSPCIATASDGGNMGYKYPPVANAGSNRTVYVNKPVTFDGSASRGNIVSYLWDFNDTHTASGETVTHTYASTGVYTVSLTANDGTTTDVNTCTVQVLPYKPTEMVYHVTNLNASGPGSFVDCLNRANSDGMASRIVFDVGGTIHPGQMVNLTEDHTTICGTNAPSPGVTIDYDLLYGCQVKGNYCTFANIAMTNSGSHIYAINLLSCHDTIIERCTFTWIVEVAMHTGAYNNIIAYCYFEYDGSQPTYWPADNYGRGIAIFSGSHAIIVGNYVGDCCRGIMIQETNIYDDTFGDVRHNWINHSHSDFNLTAEGGHQNFIENLITNSESDGIKYQNDPNFYSAGNTLLNNNPNVYFDGTGYNQSSQPYVYADTPFPAWLENAVTPTVKTQVGMGTGKCQCDLCQP